MCWNMIYIACAGAVAQNAVGYASGLHLALKSCKGGPLFHMLLSGPFCPAANARQRPRHADRSEKKGGLLLCPARLAWQLYLTQPMSTRPQSTCHHTMYPGEEGSTQRTQPAGAAQWHRRIVVDAEDSADPDPESDAGSCGGSGSGSGGSSGSGSCSGSSSGSDATSSAITVSSSDVEAAAAPPPAKKKFRRTGVRPSQCATRALPPPAIDVDAESSCAPVPHLLSEGDFFPTDTEAALKQEGKEQRWR